MRIASHRRDNRIGRINRIENANVIAAAVLILSPSCKSRQSRYPVACSGTQILQPARPVRPAFTRATLLTARTPQPIYPWVFPGLFPRDFASIVDRNVGRFSPLGERAHALRRVESARGACCLRRG